ncbi:MAG: hypothetical protein KDA80_24825 [Planctomycetaceae bacterium]|nr:hypothetical protein [Planctomycetaceae bacterium]
MIDSTTKKPLHVSTDGDSGPYIMVPVEQVDEVGKLLDGHDIRYWVDEVAISLNGEPEITVINLGHHVDAKRVQAILDNAD